MVSHCIAIINDLYDQCIQDNNTNCNRLQWSNIFIVQMYTNWLSLTKILSIWIRSECLIAYSLSKWVWTGSCHDPAMIQLWSSCDPAVIQLYDRSGYDSVMIQLWCDYTFGWRLDVQISRHDPDTSESGLTCAVCKQLDQDVYKLDHDWIPYDSVMIKLWSSHTFGWYLDFQLSRYDSDTSESGYDMSSLYTTELECM